MKKLFSFVLMCQLILLVNAQVTSSEPTHTIKKRATVEVVCGYLKVFPTELGVFEAEPSSVIAQINKQVQHGYSNWRIPTNEELSLLRANGYLGNGQYMSRERLNGIVLLVSDGDDFVIEQKAVEGAPQEKDVLRTQGWIDLGLPSGTLWKDKNEEGTFYTYDQAVAKFANNLPTLEQLKELKSSCKWIWVGNGYKVEGSNGASIFLPAEGYRGCDGSLGNVGSRCRYWSSTPHGLDYAWYLYFYPKGVGIYYYYRCRGYSVRLVR